MIAWKHKCIFIHIPKTGGTSIETAFGAWEMKSREKRKQMFYVGYPGGPCYHHYPIRQVLKECPNSKEFLKFTFVRNPWDRAISEYFYTCQNGDVQFKRAFPTPGHFIKAGHFKKQHHFTWKWHLKSQYSFIADGSGGDKMDFIGRYENLQEGFNTVCDKIGIPKKKLPHKMQSRNKPKLHYTEFYDDKSRNIIANIYKRDIEYFGYKFGE